MSITPKTQAHIIHLSIIAVLILAIVVWAFTEFDGFILTFGALWLLDTLARSDTEIGKHLFPKTRNILPKHTPFRWFILLCWGIASLNDISRLSRLLLTHITHIYGINYDG